MTVEAVVTILTVVNLVGNLLSAFVGQKLRSELGEFSEKMEKKYVPRETFAVEMRRIEERIG